MLRLPRGRGEFDFRHDEEVFHRFGEQTEAALFHAVKESAVDHVDLALTPSCFSAGCVNAESHQTK